MKSKSDAWKSYALNKRSRAASSPQVSAAAAEEISPSQRVIFEHVKPILMEQLGVDADEVQMNSNIVDDLGADSLDIVELVMAFEEEFNIEIPDEQAEKIKTVGDVVNYISRR